MNYTKVLIAAGIAALGFVLVLATLGPASQATHVADEEHEEEDEIEEHVVMQVDIAHRFATFGEPGFFKLLADFTDMQAEEAHVAVSNVQCDDEGTSPFGIIVANANVGAGNTSLATIPLDVTNLINDVSFNGTACTYHVDIEEDDFDFPVTDIALANTNSSGAHTPLPAASATVHAELTEEEEENEVVAALGSNSEVSIETEGTGELEVLIKEGDLADGVYNVTLTCTDPTVSEEFEDALLVADGEGEFETTLDLGLGTHDSCEVVVGDLEATLPSFEVTADDDLEEDDGEDEE